MNCRGPACGPSSSGCYAGFSDAVGPTQTDVGSPAGGEQYAANGRMLDLVLQYHSTSGDVGGYAAFVRDAVARYGAITRTAQITEEPNVVGNADARRKLS